MAYKIYIPHGGLLIPNEEFKGFSSREAAIERATQMYYERNRKHTIEVRVDGGFKNHVKAWSSDEIVAAENKAAREAQESVKAEERAQEQMQSSNTYSGSSSYGGSSSSLLGKVADSAMEAIGASAQWEKHKREAKRDEQIMYLLMIGFGIWFVSLLWLWFYQNVLIYIFYPAIGCLGITVESNTDLEGFLSSVFSTIEVLLFYWVVFIALSFLSSLFKKYWLTLIALLSIGLLTGTFYTYSQNYDKDPENPVTKISLSLSPVISPFYGLNQYELYQLSLVRQDDKALKEIQNEAVQLAAVQQNGDAIQYIKNPSEAVQLAAVKQGGNMIVSEPSTQTTTLTTQQSSTSSVDATRSSVAKQDLSSTPASAQSTQVQDAILSKLGRTKNFDSIYTQLLKESSSYANAENALGSAYKEARNRMSQAQQNALKNEQRNWIKQRNRYAIQNVKVSWTAFESALVDYTNERVNALRAK
jgi:uncharacterized protein YecT (DUF1311 family)